MSAPRDTLRNSETICVLCKGRWQGIGLFFIAFSVPFMAENLGEFSEHLPPAIHNWVTKVALDYQRWSMGPRSLESRYAAVVGLDQVSFSGAINESCEQRRILTRLLPRLVAAQPALIVIDLASLRDSCRSDGPTSVTSVLQSTLKSVSEDIPVIVGQSAVTLNQVSEDEKQELEAAGMGENALKLRPIIDLPAGPNARSGLIRVNRDFRRVPLERPVYERLVDGHYRYAGMRASLSLQAARQVRASFPRGTDAIESFVASGIHPYTTLISPSAFTQTRAADLLCDTELVQVKCLPETLRSARDRLRGKVVIVGWIDDGNDTHQTAAGIMPGVFLHANYVESLLDGRLLHAVSLKWQLVLTLVWFVLIE